MLSSTTSDHKFDRMIRQSFDYQRDHRKRAKRAIDYRDGKQWTAFERNSIESRGQQASVLNMCAPTIDGMSSIEKQRQSEYSVVGTESSDDYMAEILNTIVSKTLENCDFEYFISRGFRDSLAPGITWFEVVPQIDFDTKEKQIKVLHHRWEEFYYDPFASLPDKSDSRFISREVWWDRDELKEAFPGHEDDIDNAFKNGMVDEDPFTGQEYAAQSTQHYNYLDTANQRIAVHEMYYKSPSGEVKHVIFTGEIFLKGSVDGDNKSPYDHNYIPFVAMTVNSDGDGRPIGILDKFLDIQDTINKMLSKHIWNQSSKRVFYEKNSFVDAVKAKQEFAKPNAFIELRENGLSKIQVESPIAESSIIMDWVRLLVSYIQRISGINDAVIGVGGTNARSNLQESSRRNQGANMQSTILDNLYFAKRRIMKIVLLQIAQFYDTKRVVRITEPSRELSSAIGINDSLNVKGISIEINTESFPFKDMLNIYNYDVSLKEELPYTNTRELTNSMLSEIIKSSPIYSKTLIKAIINNSNIKGKESILQEIESESQIGNQLAQQQQLFN